MEDDWKIFKNTTPLVQQYKILWEKYVHVKVDQICGYELYKGSQHENSFNQEPIHLSSTVLFQLNFDVESLVWYIGGPHIALHRNIAHIFALVKKLIK